MLNPVSKQVDIQTLRGRGPESEWVNSKCAKCGGYYFGAAIKYAQAIHDRNEKCDGTLFVLEED